ncbi:gamma-secretase subunit Aph-1b-like isoform X2 [Neoarius graeffei]|uniref:gamma-secretase subunit Aph-1b-like isoform X2 n=1 Tax=Neoarius graeffei TaxID=443677 RepID=UPI00298D4CC9|nr:gamma-secretase subunit Aph-1b-like isoform X2 [Neoarius graeffei]
MTVAVFFGCAFIAFGPAFALFIFTIARDPLRVIILIAGAFFWLLSLLLSSLVWFIAVKASNADDAKLQKGLLVFGVVFSVLLQEVFRFAYYRLLRKANEGLVAISDEETSPISVQQMAYVAGLGFGIISGAFSMINILSDSLGPALMTLAMTLLHTFWGVVFFEGCEKSRWWVIAVVVCLHLLVSSLSLMNPLYEGSLPPVYLLTVAMAVWAFFSSGGSLNSLSQFCTRKKTEAASS